MNESLYGLSPELVTKPPFYNLPEWAPVFMYVLAGLATATFLYGLWSRVRLWLRGKPDFRLNDLGWRIKNFLADVFLQRKIMRRWQGYAHAALFFGFVFLFIGTDIIFVEYDVLDKLGMGIWFGGFYLWYSLILDLFGLVFLIGLGVLIARRFSKPRHLGSTTDDKLIVSLLLLIGLTGFFLEGIRLAGGQEIDGTVQVVPWAAWSPVGFVLAKAFAGMGASPGSQTVYSAHMWIWMVHMVAVMGFIAYIPFSKLLHIITSPMNMFFRNTKPYGKMETPFQLMKFNEQGELEENEDLSEEEFFAGAYGKFEDMTWRHMLEFDACTKCARCTVECPATLAGRPLSPMHFIQDLRIAMGEQLGGNQPETERRTLVGDDGVIRPETLWSCTTCNACVEACPVMIEHVDLYLGMRRHLSNEQNLPGHVVETLKKIQNNFNPWGLASADRMSWADDAPIKPVTLEENPEPEILYWIGCAGNLDSRNQEVTKAILKIFDHAGVNYAILGKEEKCTAEVARRMGDEGTFQQFAFENIMIMNEMDIKRIVTACPHCFNTFANEYPELGLKAETIHHADFIKELIDGGRLKLDETKKVNKKITFHDSCYLGRHNDILESPRELLTIAGVDLVEMDRSRKRGLCCGAGGANMWYEVPEDVAINKHRVQEAVETGAEGSATACPFCMFMFVDGQKKLDIEEKFSQHDVAEYIAQVLPEKKVEG